ncbi:sugar ABC transporter permease [Comamonadaceae bacterium G21597-S1]|nr:sugar ABC transporter permease [Comamonadaceae bacterium G21597-S1]
MKTRSFLQFVGPSVAMMVLLLAIPMATTFYLSVRNCALEMEMVTVEESTPFGKKETVTQRARMGPDGRALQTCEFVGLDYYRKVLGLDASQDAATAAQPPDAGGAPAAAAGDAADNEFLGALTFTMIYTFTTLPFVLVIGFLLALGVNNVTTRLRGMFITASLLPFIITPVVAALSIKWLFRDNGLVPYLLSNFGIEVFWMAQAWSARLLIIVYGIWHVVPFAFIVLYAGLQSVPQDALEAATIDGATRWQKLRYVTVPHLMPLIVFITLIHLMDAYRVFEPVIVLTQGAFTTSVQYLTYHILLLENNPYKASAAAVLTLAGIVVLLIPLLVRTWREQKGGV